MYKNYRRKIVRKQKIKEEIDYKTNENYLRVNQRENEKSTKELY